MTTWELYSTYSTQFDQDQYGRDPAPMSDDEESQSSFIEVKPRRKNSRGKKRPSITAPKVVEVVECPSAFPFHKRYHDDGRPGADEGSTSKRVKIHDTSASSVPAAGFKGGKDVNFFDMYREVRDFGSQGFTGDAKDKHKRDLYKQITGREKKGPKMSWKRHIEAQRERADREKRDQEDARVSGMVNGSTSAAAKKRKREDREKKRIKEKRRNISLYGPAPSIGYMKSGTYQAKK